MIRYHLANLANFQGRESRARFWPWAGLVSVAMMMTIAAIVARYLAAMKQRTDGFAAAIRETGELPLGANPLVPAPQATGLLAWVGIAVAGATLLLAAAMVRRLHDREASGIWVALPVPPLLVMAWAFPTLFFGGAPDMRIYFAIMAASFLHSGAMIALLVLLTRAGTPGRNPYGEPEFRG